MSEIMRLKPVNRHLLIIPHNKKNETSSGVILPEDYNPEQEVYVEATVIDVAEDCSKQFNSLRYGTIGDEKKIIVDRSMIQEVNVRDKKHYLVLENYVVGVYRRANEN
mgnify:CR=1 FL=1